MASLGVAESSGPTRAATPPSEAADNASASEKIAELRREIAHHDARYFKKAAPEISDARYDELKRDLAQLERSFPEVARTIAPLPALGDDRTPGFSSQPHRQPMQGLDKVYAERELRAFLQRTRAGQKNETARFLIEPKYDGVALSVTYERGELTRALTRGNGQEGDDVTANARAIRNLPHRLHKNSPGGAPLPIPEIIELRGEVFLSDAEFQRLNRERETQGDPSYTHPRNLAAGTLKQHDPNEIRDRGLEIVFHGLGELSPVSAMPATQAELYALVGAWGLPVSNYKKASSDAEVLKAVRQFGEARPKLGFPTDGVVVKLDSIARQRELGAGDSAPRWAIAYKFPAERGETTLLAITLQVGRTGALTPVAELAPVRLGGATIARASLHNRLEIARLGLQIGDRVLVEKAGEIIPRIVGVSSARRSAESRPFVFPTTCPACKTRLIEDETAAVVHCPNRDCPPQIQRRFEHFASAEAVNIARLGPATIETLVSNGWVKGIPDLYRLRRAQLLTLGRDLDVSVDRLLTAIEASKHAELWRFIHGLGIRGIGVAGAHELANYYGSLEALAGGIPTRSPVGRKSSLKNTTAKAVADYFRDPHHSATIAELISLGVNPTKSTPPPAEKTPGDLLPAR